MYLNMIYKKSPLDWIADDIIIIFLLFLSLITLYPFLFVLSMSISDPMEVLKMTIVLFPKGFSLKSYQMIVENPNVWMYYYNTIWYTVVGVVVNIFVTVTFAYPLSRKNFCLKKGLLIFLAIPMFIGGGMIPSFMVIKYLGLYDTRWALILSGAMSMWVAVMARVYFQITIPESLIEAAKIDGCTDVGILGRIVIPLSKPILAVIGLFNAVSYWNLYFNAVLYISNPKIQPLQVYLQKIIVKNSPDLTQQLVGQLQRSMYGNQMKYSIIIFSILPIICVYPLLQKYFVKGIMVGSLKG